VAAPSRAKFEAAQNKARTAGLAVRNAEITLAVKYGSANVRWASRAEQRKLEQLRERRDRACERIFAMLEEAPRDWTTGVPQWWVCTELTYDDAFRSASKPLSATPPLSFGATEPKRSLLNNFPNPFALRR
jgi:hypothetical protein